MKLDFDNVAGIEAATRDQGDRELWHTLRNGRLTSSRFGEIRNRKETTILKDWSGSMANN